MLILFDHGAPRGISRVLRTHTVVTAKARRWERLANGALLTAAEEAAFDLLFTTDNDLAYQQLDWAKDCDCCSDRHNAMVSGSIAS
jgi:hypothetical protein